jgi:hypothetical protein
MVTNISCYLNGVIRHPTVGLEETNQESWGKPRNVYIFMKDIQGQLQEPGQPPHPPNLSLKMRTF